ncbi:MAG: peptide chain release factor N(5)-glutamine methyltransferase [Clostridia bacterium]|nr:peptide chain release factor N(5)-glutamine methyltransferase [Lachnospiraceae bacterium]NCB99792.1 peptide chain release factor N(5)-glutamine methyltransferase [Clostridia bacterium]NCD01939.1 peptide chain release factor N(5)-glutamine methyltransferase [Clostridia bacterium]
MKTLRQLMKDGEARLLENEIENSTMEARLLLEYICDLNWSQYLLQADTEADPQEQRRYEEAVERRCSHYPLQYILGTVGFMDYEFMVNESVLIPRQDTEVLVETVLNQADISGGSVLDMCTGSGCILISLMAMGHYKSGTGVDLSEEALRVARMNGIFNRIHWMKDGRSEDDLTWIQSDLFCEVDGQYDVIVSNPPYIPADVIETLMPEVRDYEPRMALEGADEGLEFYKKITQAAETYLKPSGWLFFEIGAEQGKAVSELMEKEGFKEIRTVRDLAGLDRVVYGRR